jgi:hypothetical protein
MVIGKSLTQKYIFKTMGKLEDVILKIRNLWTKSKLNEKLGTKYNFFSEKIHN